MRVGLVLLCVLAATLALSVQSKPHGKHHRSPKPPHAAKEKDTASDQDNQPQVLPTLVTLVEEKNLDQEDEDLSSEGNGEMMEGGRDKSAAVLLSEEELVDLLKKEAAAEDEEKEVEEEEEEEEVEEEEEEEETEREEEEAEVDEGKVQVEEAKDEVMEKTEEQLLEETDGSTALDVPVDLDYAADSSVPLQTVSARVKPLGGESRSPSKTLVPDEKEPLKSEEETGDPEVQNTEAAAQDGKTGTDQAKSKDLEVNQQGPRSTGVPEPGAGPAGEKSGNDSVSRGKGKSRKQRKSQRARKHSPQRDAAAQAGQEVSQVDAARAGQEMSLEDAAPTGQEVSRADVAQKAKRRRAGKWGPLVGINPVQIRATVDLYPSTRPSPSGGSHHQEDPADPCDNYRCKRGKTCKLDGDKKPACVCQEASECAHSATDFDHVCGTDNTTYDTSCELFATKCKLEGTKRGHRLHLDYTGPCKLIPACVDAELVQFPLRMRDWLKNVLLQLYDHDSVTPGFLTPKQRFRVKKLSESERRLHAGDHSVELLAQDFEKNYNMYIYPVHWQFAQLDQHPSDRFLSHSELAPLRVPLVPMEHCTSLFFQECDADKDKQVSFKEWTSCFGINSEDMDVNLLF